MVNAHQPKTTGNRTIFEQTGFIVLVSENTHHGEPWASQLKGIKNLYLLGGLGKGSRKKDFALDWKL